MSEYFSFILEQKEKLTAAWNQATQNISPELRNLITEFQKDGADNRPQRMAFLQAHPIGGRTLGAYLRDECLPLVRCCVPESDQEAFLCYADRMVENQYTEGPLRRTLRSRLPAAHFCRALDMLATYLSITANHLTVLDVMHPSPELGMRLLMMRSRVSETIAARLNQGDPTVTAAIEDALTAENNNATVTTPIIRAIVQSDARPLHELLGKLLVAARLQEGLRQAICENADCGTKAAFLEILKVIEENDLLRFSSVKRAVGTWCGMFSEEHADRVSKKVFDDLCLAARDVAAARRLTESNDSVEIMAGLWGLGFEDAELALGRVRELIQTGTRNQLLTVSYYAQTLQQPRLCQQAYNTAMQAYGGDEEVLAAFLPCCLNGFSAATLYEFRRTGPKAALLQYFDDEAAARACFAQLQAAHAGMTKAAQTFSPLIFPWYGVTLEKSDIVCRMAYLAALLEDDALTDAVCPLLSQIKDVREYYLELLLKDPRTPVQRKTLIQALADRSTYTRKAALELVRKLTLTPDECKTLEGFLKYKSEDLRQNVIEILHTQSSPETSLPRLLASKAEAVRLAGLDLARRWAADGREVLPLVREAVSALTPTAREQVLLDAMDGQAEETAALYDPHARFVLEVPPADEKLIQSFFSLTESDLDSLMQRARAILEPHFHDEFSAPSGESQLLGNGLEQLHWWTLTKNWEMPFPELWVELNEALFPDEKAFWNLLYALVPEFVPSEAGGKLETELFGACAGYSRRLAELYKQDRAWRQVNDILMPVMNVHIRRTYHPHMPEDVARAVCAWVAQRPHALWVCWKHSMVAGAENWMALQHWGLFGLTISELSNFPDEESFRLSFPCRYQLQAAYAAAPLPEGADAHVRYVFDIYEVLYAHQLGIIPRNELYRLAMESLDLRETLQNLSVFVLGRAERWLRQDTRLVQIGACDPETKALRTESPMVAVGKQLYNDILDVVLDVELKRGDSPTRYSSAVSGVRRVFGLSRLGQILRALGTEKLDRSVYFGYGSSAPGKTASLCHLLRCCYPLPGDTAADFAALMDALKLKPGRVIEIAMYAPQWMPMIEAWLGYAGFSAGCWYFMAHMDEQFDDRKMAFIARYSPLSAEELQAGCFDTTWFFDVYNQLGEERFNQLYDAAKYITDGSKHSRARKYADAALGRVPREALEQAIRDKRSKDSVMSYGLIPLTGSEDTLHRYEFLQGFLKESKTFGAQRRASESKAVEAALKNLATTAGYRDALRLTLAMETALVRQNAAYFAGVSIDGYDCRIAVEDLGKPSLIIAKGGKALKSAPAALKKSEAFLNLRDFAKKLSDQYARCVSMFEAAMETRETYTVAELRGLCENPVLAGILSALVFITEQGSALLCDLPEQGTVRFAHPYDLYAEGSWTRWQQEFFERRQQQPFRQVFRELYVKLREELDDYKSRLFAGHQVQPAKTLALLKGRGWVLDPDCCIQKVFYREKLVAQFYAVADWFSPAEIEPPTLEFIAFFNRDTGNMVPLREIPDIIYSEVMRDADLVVSVAHAGGVDPMASHSTIEMRAVIASFNIQLFKLTNARVEGAHILIHGVRGDYSIHLGSGAVHQSGKLINVLSVHSQQRGAAFLPFLDGDPKTAEIISKLILFARDTKIQDPSILEQLL